MVLPAAPGQFSQHFTVLYQSQAGSIGGSIYRQLHIKTPYELRDSSNYLKRVIDGDSFNNSYVFIHTSTFSMTPYKIYFKDYNNVENYLCSELTRKQLFTTGGSVVSDFELLSYNETCERFNNQVDGRYVYFISDKELKEVVLWQRDGLIVTRNVMNGETKIKK